MRTLGLLVVASLAACSGASTAEPPLTIDAGAADATPTATHWIAPAADAPTFGRHTATRLTDGRVLVIGAVTSDLVATGGALYDPDTHAWRLLSSAPPVREGHTATRLADGRVVIIGGEDASGALSASVVVFNPASDSFTPGDPSFTLPPPPLRQALAFHTATALPDGSVLVAGGVVAIDFNEVVTADVERLDADTWTWVPVAPLATARAYHTASMVDGKVVVVGGLDGDHGIASVARFTPGNDEWTDGPALNDVAIGHTATPLADGSLLVVDSFGAWRGDASWHATGAMTHPRANHVAAMLADGRVLVVGGAPYEELHTPEIYDPGADRWRDAAANPFGLFDGSATTLADGEVLVIADQAWRYVP